MEQWKDVVGFEGRYQVSNLGRVKSLLGRTDKILLPKQKSNCNEKEVNLSVGGKHKMCMVHRLVLEAFVGPRPEKHIASALDGNTGNAVLENLVWALESEVRATQRGEKNKAAQLTNEQALAVKVRLLEAKADNEGVTPRGLVAQIAKEYGVRHETVRKINVGQSYCWL